MTSTSDSLGQLSAVLGEAQVDTAAAAQTRYGQDTTGAQRRLAGAVRVRSLEEVRKVVALTAHQGQALHPISTGRNWGYGSSLPAGQDCILLDLGAMNRILEFDADLGIITLEPGVTQADLASFLAQGQHPYLVPVTGAGPSCSLLANALERGYGVTPHTDHFAAVTDLQAVMPDGTVYHSMLHEAAGARTAGLYRWGLGPYSAGLFTQSGFGIVTRISLALARKVDVTQVALFSLRHADLIEPAVAAVRAILTRLPGIVGGINLMNQHRVLAMSAPYPWESVGPDGLLPEAVVQALGQQYQVFPWTGFCTLYGPNRMVKAARAEIRAALRGLASRLLFITPQRARQLHRLSRLMPGALGHRLHRLTGTLAQSLDLVAGQPNETALPLAYWRHRNPPTGSPRQPARDGCGLMWYAPLVPMQAKSVSTYQKLVTQTCTEHGIEPLITFTTLNDRCFDSTVPILFDRTDPAAVQRAQQCFESLLFKGRESGFFPYRLPVDAMPLLRQLAPAATAFHERLMRTFDPQRLLAPGRYS